MKFNSDIKEGTAGLVFKKKTYTLLLDVQFSEEEKEQITRMGFDKDPKRVLISGINGDSNSTGELWVSTLMRNQVSFQFDDIVDANNCKSIAISALKDLKEQLNVLADSGPTSIEI